LPDRLDAREQNRTSTMKMLTEFSGTVLRMAQNALPPAPPPPAEGTEAAPVDTAAIEAAIGGATGISGDRATRLREALDAASGKLANVRLVRIYAGETGPAGSRKIGEHHFVVELMPESMKPNFQRPEKERGGRGGRDGGKRGEGRGGPKA